ncbi:uncharacterized protein [Euwallacea similis]|uniref:uncharacterized protein n=1 Tax=Euwallacea similis TaxID=1736056 RepID=UPI003450E71A
MRKRSVPETWIRKEEIEGMETGFARRGRVQRTPPKDKGEENCTFSTEESPESAPKGKRKRMEESHAELEEARPKTMLEVAKEQMAEVDRILRESYHPKQELVDAVSELKSTIRSMVIGEEGKDLKTKNLEEENSRLRGEITRLMAGKRKGVSVECQTETEEERTKGEFKEKLTILAKEGRILEAIKERWDEEIFGATEVAYGDPISEGFRMDLAILVGKGESSVKERFLQFLPELRKLETEEGRIPSLIQTCNLRKEGKVITKQKHVYFQELNSTGSEGVFEALRKLTATMLEKRRESVVISLIPEADPWKLRKVCEFACWNLETKIRIKLYLPGRTTTGGQAVKGPDPKRKEEGVVFVAKQEGVSYNDTLRRVYQLVANSQTKVDIGTVRVTKKGEVLITLPKEGKQGEKLKDILGKGLGKDKVRSGGYGQTVVFQITGMDGVITGDDAIGAVAAATGLDPKKLRLKGLRTNYGSCQTATILVRERDAAGLRGVTSLKIGINMCRLRERKDTGRCYRCWKSGHRVQECKGVYRTRLCSRCGKEGHRARECKDPRYCPLCKAEGHSAGGPGCKGPVKALAGGRETTPKNTGGSEPRPTEKMDEAPGATGDRNMDQGR